jgi:hypothetical protein
LEDLLVGCYDLDLNAMDVDEPESVSTIRENPTVESEMQMETRNPNTPRKINDLQRAANIPTSPLISKNVAEPEVRKANIMEFLGNIPKSSENFTKSPSKVRLIDSCSYPQY